MSRSPIHHAHLRRSLLGLVTALALATACGPGTPRSTEGLRARLASDETAPARERAPELIARVEQTLDEAEAAEARGDEAAASDHATRARLLLEAAMAEAARARNEAERADMEREIATLLERARRDEAARAEIASALTQRAAAATAREEALRALRQAEQDEGRPARRRRVSMEEAADLRRAAAALRARARLTLAAARALGGDDEALGPASEALDAAEAERDPAEGLAASDRAHHAALRALGAARASAEGPSADAPAALAEAATEQGFTALALPEGTAVEAEGLFRGASTTLAGASRARVERLATLVQAHPHGPVQVQAQAAQMGSAGDRVAERRAEAVRVALIAAGVDPDRITAQPIPSALRGDTAMERVRAVFVAYARRAGD